MLGSLMPDHWCLGTTTVVRIFVWLTNCEDGKVTVTWLPFAPTSPYGIALLFRAGVLLRRLNVKATSSAVIAWPSDHLTLSRMVSVSLR